MTYVWDLSESEVAGQNEGEQMKTRRFSLDSTSLNLTQACDLLRFSFETCEADISTYSKALTVLRSDGPSVLMGPP